MPSFLADYRDLPRFTRIVTTILLPVLLLAGVIGGSNATNYVAVLGERCALEMPIGTIVELDTPDLFAQRIARNKWMLTSDLIVNNCYVKDHIKKTRDDCEPQDRACRLTFSPVGATIQTSDGQTWTKTALNEWQNESGDIRNDAAMSQQSTSTQHNAAGNGGQPNCKRDEPTNRKPCSSSSAAKRHGTKESSSSAANTCTAVYYKFDEGAGTTAANALGSDHPGSLDGATWNADHAPTLFQNSGAIAFDGSNKVTVPTLAPPTSPFTISTWIKAPMTELADQIVVQWGDESWTLAVGHRAFNTFACFWQYTETYSVYSGPRYYDSRTSPDCGGNTPGTVVDDTPHENYYFGANTLTALSYDFNENLQMPHDTWVHLTYVNDGSPPSNPSTKRLYVNGVDFGPATSEASGDSPLTGLTIGNLNSAATWQDSEGSPSVQRVVYTMDHPGGGANMETINYWYPAQGFNGLIDDVRVYTRALSTSEVASLAAGEDVSFNCTQ